ncbi:hypothetical protein PTKU46_90230 [Paraburkholderia terrae]|uniref:hypothetical protein n=1 Tax=Paraburkholderia terrae TaxID=311230 RepID=UPI0030E37346
MTVTPYGEVDASMTLLAQMLRREHEGDQHELVSLRQELSHLHACLFDAYMATRKAYDGADADPIGRWFCPASDARTDPTVTEQIVRFIDHHGARSVVPVNRIIGCPYEEGVDYPEGEICPLCSFWRNRDRWSGESIN